MSKGIELSKGEYLPGKEADSFEQACDQARRAEERLQAALRDPANKWFASRRGGEVSAELEACDKAIVDAEALALRLKTRVLLEGGK